ncbi:MAG: hypothetical protein ACLRQF_00935 [Thomasclavelia ramosa]
MNFEFSDDDVVFFITATGRMMERNVKKLKPQNICDAYLVLITQNLAYRDYENVCADYLRMFLVNLMVCNLIIKL